MEGLMHQEITRGGFPPSDSSSTCLLNALGMHRPDALCTSAQTVSWPRVRIALRRLDCGDNHMIFFVGAGIVLIAVGTIPRVRVRGGVLSANLGWMSQQWLAEHRASHSL